MLTKQGYLTARLRWYKDFPSVKYKMCNLKRYRHLTGKCTVPSRDRITAEDRVSEAVHNFCAC